MTPNLSFKEISDYLKEDNKELVESIDRLFGFALILPTLIYGPSAEVAISTLKWIGAKNELVKIGGNIFDKFTKKKDDDLLARMKRMEISYGLISYTAFFEAIDARCPGISDYIGLLAEERIEISKASATKTQRKRKTTLQKEEALLDIRQDSLTIPLPHPVKTFDKHSKQLLPLYQEMTKGYQFLLESLPLWIQTDEKVRTQVYDELKKLPEVAVEYFKAQYFLLATKYNDFFVWSNLQQHKESRKELKTKFSQLTRKLSGDIKKQVQLSKESKRSIDLGFTKLATAIRSLPLPTSEQQSVKALEELNKIYKENINRPVIEDTYKVESGDLPLTYPKKSEIFVPQSFKAIIYKSNERLEDDETWKNVNSRDDLGTFILSYMCSPHCLYAPLIILGHPGSGKSLLTHILSARLHSSLYFPIRVELRDVDADNEISSQIEEQIRKDTTRNVTWANVADQLKSINKPALVLLDGYDELLQASGLVFSNYLIKVQNFQSNEFTIRQPVPTIVTSRITLIDKASIPRGATIVKLEEFDEPRRKKWISVWNSANKTYFDKKEIKSFEIPPKDEKIIPLASQPLLLLMLALYDSDSNQLRTNTNLDRTKLYNSLLLRFVKRERNKDEDFESHYPTEKDREEEYKKDMERLGIAALGMYNRRSLYIRTDQLDGDIEFFEMERKVPQKEGRKLSQADLLLGSFFFIHKSKSKLLTKGDATDESQDSSHNSHDTAFEFLHNTFGEFLTADFILRKVLEVGCILHQNKNNPLFKNILDNPDSLLKQWLPCLIYTPLYSRPVILDMMREWLVHQLSDNRISHKDFLEVLDLIFINQIKRIISGNSLPSIMMGTEQTQPTYPLLPFIGHTAIYSLNLVTLRTVLSKESFSFDEELYYAPTESNQTDGTRAWDRLAYLWRSWFSIDYLNELTAILTAEREGTKITLRAKDDFIIKATDDRFEKVLNLSLTLADNITYALAMFAAYDSLPLNQRTVQLDYISSKLNSEEIYLRPLDAQIHIDRLRKMINERGSESEVFRSFISYLNNFRHDKDPFQLINIFGQLIIKVKNPHLQLDMITALFDYLPIGIQIAPVTQIISASIKQNPTKLQSRGLLRMLFKYLERGRRRIDYFEEHEIIFLDLITDILLDYPGVYDEDFETFDHEIMRYADDLLHHIKYKASKLPITLVINLIRLVKATKNSEFIHYTSKHFLAINFDEREAYTVPPRALIELAIAAYENEHPQWRYIYELTRRHLNIKSLTLDMLKPIQQMAQDLGDTKIIKQIESYLH